ncbi:ABC transporter ATP-binding protein [Mesorhizobium sp. ZMM04-5]|uniref:ABC transporter ATP-binding protein n=1 Tax=Mesorhizobium marinum TaxID=3228790 RepID=A0ABV3R573_9HYPH
MLEVSGLAVDYGKHAALHGVGLTVAEAETVVILGANGAGKSTLLKAVAGLVRPRPGSVIDFAGQRIAGRPGHEILEAGIALVPEGRGLFPDLTVSENLRLGAHAHRARKDEAANLAMVHDLFPRLVERRRQTVSTMSGGEQQMVAIGRALMSAPRLLMLDEPSLGLAPVLVGELFATLAEIGRRGVSLLIVEQNVRASLSIAGRGYLLEAGRMVGEGPATRLINDPAVQHAFMGASAEA